MFDGILVCAVFSVYFCFHVFVLLLIFLFFFFFFSSRRRHTRLVRDWSSDVCSSDLDNGLLLKMTPMAIPAMAMAKTVIPRTISIPKINGKKSFKTDVIIFDQGSIL